MTKGVKMLGKAYYKTAKWNIILFLYITSMSGDNWLETCKQMPFNVQQEIKITKPAKMCKNTHLVNWHDAVSGLKCFYLKGL